MRNFKPQGFTLVELLVSIVLIAILSGVLIFYSRSSQNFVFLEQSANQVLFDVDRVRNLALSSFRTGTKVYCGYGIHFFDPSDPQSPKDRYVVFGDIASPCSAADRKRNSNGSEDISTSILNVVSKTTIKSTTVTDLVFVPPDPAVYFDGQTNRTATITVQLGTLTENICINSIGQATIC